MKAMRSAMDIDESWMARCGWLETEPRLCRPMLPPEMPPSAASCACKRTGKHGVGLENVNKGL